MFCLTELEKQPRGWISWLGSEVATRKFAMEDVLGRGGSQAEFRDKRLRSWGAEDRNSGWLALWSARHRQAGEALLGSHKVRIVSLGCRDKVPKAGSSQSTASLTPQAQAQGRGSSSLTSVF